MTTQTLLILSYLLSGLSSRGIIIVYSCHQGFVPGAVRLPACLSTKSWAMCSIGCDPETRGTAGENRRQEWPFTVASCEESNFLFILQPSCEPREAISVGHYLVEAPIFGILCGEVGDVCTPYSTFHSTYLTGFLMWGYKMTQHRLLLFSWSVTVPYLATKW